VRNARSYREKCAVLLGAALNSKLALEQVAEAATCQGETNLLSLRRLCSKLLGTLRLGETRVKLYGRCVRALVTPWRVSLPRVWFAHCQAHATRRAARAATTCSPRRYAWGATS